MIGKVEIDEARKKRIIEKAGHFADEITLKWGDCAPATFAAICETFRSEGIEFFSPEVQEMMTQGMMGLHAGIAETGVGTCGAITGSAFVVSYVVGVTTEELEKNPELGTALTIPIVEGIMDRFEEEYGATDCLRLRYNRTQRALDFLDPDAAMWHIVFALSEGKKCALGPDADTYEGGREWGMPAVGVRWAAEVICDLLNMEPEERKKVPPHLKGLKGPEMISKAQKVAQALKELDFGRPNEKISWREYRKFKLKGKKGLEEERPGPISAPKEE